MHRCTTSELLDSILLETQKRLGVKMMIARTKWSVQEVHAVHSSGATASPSLLSLKVALYVWRQWLPREQRTAPPPHRDNRRCAVLCSRPCYLPVTGSKSENDAFLLLARPPLTNKSLFTKMLRKRVWGRSAVFCTESTDSAVCPFPMGTLNEPKSTSDWK